MGENDEKRVPLSNFKAHDGIPVKNNAGEIKSSRK